MKHLLVFVTLLFFSQAIGQNLHMAKVMGGGGYDIGHGIAVDSQHNTYTTGGFQSTADFDPNWSVHNMNSAGAMDMFIVKLDSAGYFVWAKKIGSISDDAGDEIYYDNGVLTVLGHVGGAADIDPGPGVFPSGGAAAFIAKMDTAGNFISASLLPSGNYVLDIDQNQSQYVGISFFQGTVDFDPGPAVFPLTSQAFHDFVVYKTDAVGNFQWAKLFAGSFPKQLTEVKSDQYGNVYLTGGFSGSLDVDPGPGVHTIYSEGAYDVFVIKLHDNGELIWASRVGGNDSDLGVGIGMDMWDNVYVAGEFRSTVDFDPGIAVHNLTAPDITFSDVFYLKLDSAGNFIWGKQVGSTDDDWITRMLVDSNGNVYCSGVFRGVVDMDPGPGYLFLNEATGRVFTQKIDSAGNCIWAKNCGGNNSSIFFYGLVLDAWNNLYVTGVAQGTALNWDPGVTNFSTGSTNAAIAILKYGPTIGFPLSVDLLSFDARLGDQKAYLDWQTGSEVSSAHFEVERSANGDDWSYVSSVPASGISQEEKQYAFVDEHPLGGTSFYRLKLVDLDGSFSYSPVRMVRQTVSPGELSVYPNPTAGVLTVELEGSIDPANLKLFNILGMDVTRSVIYSYSGNQLQADLSVLAPGIYTLVCGDTKTLVHKR